MSKMCVCVCVRVCVRFLSYCASCILSMYKTNFFLKQIKKIKTTIWPQVDRHEADSWSGRPSAYLRRRWDQRSLPQRSQQKQVPDETVIHWFPDVLKNNLLFCLTRQIFWHCFSHSISQSQQVWWGKEPWLESRDWVPARHIGGCTSQLRCAKEYWSQTFGHGGLVAVWQHDGRKKEGSRTGTTNG